MWAIKASDGNADQRQSESDARQYVARHYPNATRIGIYSFRAHGVAITIHHI